MNKNVLVIDTTSDELFVALITKEKTEKKLVADCRSKHSVCLLPEIDKLLCQNGLKIEDVDVCALSVGPGSFTGIRIGVATAKAFQYALSMKIIAVNSLEAAAYNYKGDGKTVAIIDAKHGNAFTGIYEDGKETLCFLNTEKLKDELSDAKHFVSPYENSFGATVVEDHYDGLLAVIKEKLQKNEYSENFAPLYLKLSQAEEEENDRKTVDG